MKFKTYKIAASSSDGAHVRAGDGRVTVTMPWDHARDGAEAHESAALELARTEGYARVERIGEHATGYTWKAV